MPLSRKPSEKKHSHNPLKFFRSSSHHDEAVPSTGSGGAAATAAAAAAGSAEPKKAASHHFGIRSRSNTVRSEVQPSAAASSEMNKARAHMANPFLKTSHTFDLGSSGTDIAAPRNSTASHGGPLPGGLSRTPSMNHNKPVYNPYGLNSRTPSTYSMTAASSDDDKKHLLATPIRDPNDMLPLDLKQEFHTLSDGFVFPEKNRKKLGDGASATVFLVQHKKTFKNYALKKFQLLPHETDEEFYKRAAKEFIIAKRLSDSKHIVTTFYCLKIQTTTNITRGWGFILDYCVGGDLFNLIMRPGWKAHPIVEKYCIFKQLVFAVDFIHSKGIVHRDLKPENILIDANGLVKITDFGIAEYTHEDETDLDSPLKTFNTFVGSPPYVPPEMMKIQKDHCGEYDPYKLDLWGVGVILFVLIYQNAPFKSAATTDQAYRDFVSSYKTYIAANPSFRFDDVNHGPGIEFKFAKEFHSAGAARVAWRLCDYSEEHRYTMKDILKDPWFIGLECCCDGDDDEVDPLFQNSRTHSVDSLPSSSMIAQSPVPKPAQSPVIKATKSMLDFSTAATPQGAQHPPLGESEASNASEPMLLTASQAQLPPVAEAHDEHDSLSSSPVDTFNHLGPSPLKNNNNCDDTDIESNHQETLFNPPSMCDLTKVDTIVVQQPTHSPPQHSKYDSSGLSLEALRITPESHMPHKINAMASPTTPIEEEEVPPQSSNATVSSSSATSFKAQTPSRFERASSFSSNRSLRSLRSNGSTSDVNSHVPSRVQTPTGAKRRVRHHHLDVSTVSNHGVKR